MKIVLAGATGFIGSSLTSSLLKEGHQLVILTRKERSSKEENLIYQEWDGKTQGPWDKHLEGAHGVINLAGEPVAQRWSNEKKRSILESRVDATRAIVNAISRCRKKPSVLINASAVGYYGARREEVTEDSPPGFGFLSDVCGVWEKEAMKAKNLGVRVVLLRTGIVLAKEGGALQKMLPPFKLGVGGPLGDGRQFMPWIHRDDAVGIIKFALENEGVEGPLNVVAPHPVTMNEFAKTLSRILKKPAVFKVPSLVIKTLMGEMADVVLTGQDAKPKRLLEYGYVFLFSELRKALEDILKRK